MYLCHKLNIKIQSIYLSTKLLLFQGGKSTYGRKGKTKQDDFADIGAGYDENDSFIDNTDGVCFYQYLYCFSPPLSFLESFH